MNKRIEKLLEQVRVNEQIERIAEQAGCTIDRLGYGEGNLEKFAELIVRECGSYLNSPEFIGRSDLDWAMVLNEHFGVEECVY